MADKIDFFQIYWKEEQKIELFDFATPYMNEGLTPFFENDIIAKLVPASSADKICVTSWALRRKMTMRIPPREDLTLEALQRSFDVMSFSKNAPDHDMFVAAETWHKGWKAIFFDLWLKIYGERPSAPKNPIYQNAFCARREVYKLYVKEFLIPAMEFMENDEEMKKRLWVDSGYRVTTLGFPINTQKCQQYFGVPWYPMHPFILERAFSCWLDRHKGLKIIYL